MNCKCGVSVIIPVYNVQKYLRDCLDSVLAQTYTDYEIICVDDASTDTSLGILYEYQQKYKFLQIITHDENRGLSAARNTGLDHAAGRYVVFLDSDDMLEKEALYRLYCAAEEKSLEMIIFDYSEIYEEGLSNTFAHAEVREKEKYPGVLSGRDMFCRYIHNNDVSVSAWTKMYLREFIERNKLRFYEGILHEDVLFFFQCMMSAERVMDLEQQYYIYRVRHASIMRTSGNLHAESYFFICMAIYRFLWESSYDEETNSAIAEYLDLYWGKYRRYRQYCDQTTSLSFGSLADRKLYELITHTEKKRYISLSEEKLQRLKQQEMIIVYGAGSAAVEILDILHDHHIPVDAVAVTDKSVNAEQVSGMKIQEIRELEMYKNRAMVIVAVTPKYTDGMVKLLREIGFSSWMEADYLH